MPNTFALTLKAQNSYPASSVVQAATQQIPDLSFSENDLISGVFEVFGSGAVNSLTINASNQISSVLNGGTAVLLTNPITNANLVMTNFRGLYISVTQRDPLVEPASVQPTATSTTSVAIGTGSKTFTVATGLAYVTNMRVRITHSTTATNYMEGVVSGYTSGTGALVVTVDKISGTGTIDSWTVTGIVCAQVASTDFGGITFTTVALRENAAIAFTSPAAIKAVSGNVLNVYLNGTTGLNVNVLVIGS
jgi:hypothetical protein